jgi:hypothetical protein
LDIEEREFELRTNGQTVERMQVWKITCEKSREYSTVTRDHHIFFGGNQN